MQKSFNSFLKKISLPLMVFLAVFLLAKAGLAAGELDLGVEQIDSNIILNSTSPMVVAVRIIQVLLSLLGLITVVIIIYAGFLWTTSGGNEDKISQAKKLIKNAAIGLLIILSAWGITYFVLNKILGITGGSGQQDAASNKGNNNSLSLGAIGSCVIESVYPAPSASDVSRNTSILITSKEAFELDSVCVDKTNKPCACDNTNNCNLINSDNIQIYKTADGNNTNTNLKKVEVSVPSGNKTLVLKPIDYLGDSNGNVEYGVRLTNDLRKSGGDRLFSTCSSNFLEWFFETNNKLDLSSPQIVSGGIFPPVDNYQDVFSVLNEAKAAQAKITIISCPQAKTNASKISITKIGSSVEADFVVDPSYSGVITQFMIEVSDNKMKLFSGTNLLGSTDIVSNKATFEGYFTITLASVVSGNSWNLVVKPATAAEKLIVGSNTYLFVKEKTGAGNEILIPSVCSANNLAINLELVLSGHPDVVVSNSGGILTLFAKQTGVSGNSITLDSNSAALVLSRFSGGSEKKDSYLIKGVKDKPMNSIIQVNFNESVNPMTLVGSADELKNYVRLVNANSGAKTGGASCSQNSDCLSYDCQLNVCAGNYVSGNFSLSNSYKTLEFISNKECGVNSCGEKMYCLPASSHLKLQISAAKLKSCSSINDCSGLSPYSDCVASICRDTAKATNYPLADTLNLTGVVDLAFNSLDGNRDNKADGPVTTVYPYFIENSTDLNKRDGFEFLFWISNQINLTPPSISLTSPRLEESSVNLMRPVVIDFNDLMMTNTLRTGSFKTNNGLIATEHKLINLRNLANKPLGYWLESQNKEIGTPDGEPDFTSLKILHSDFFEAVTYVSQTGSGVKNIYQNCFKPSIGPACLNLSEVNPSCCFGSETNSLNTDGNCAE